MIPLYVYSPGQWALLFFFYCFCGWVWESCYVSAKQPFRCAFVQIRRDGGQRVCHHIQLPQRLGQLGDVELEGRFHGVQEHRVLFPAVLSRQRELPAEHPLYQLQQQRLLTGKNMEE